MIERVHLELPDVRKVTRRVHEGRRFMSITHNDEPAQLFRDSGETLNSQQTPTTGQDVDRAVSIMRERS